MNAMSRSEFSRANIVQAVFHNISPDILKVDSLSVISWAGDSGFIGSLTLSDPLRLRCYKTYEVSLLSSDNERWYVDKLFVTSGSILPKIGEDTRYSYTFSATLPERYNV